MMILVTLSIATGLAAKLAVDRAEKLDHSNKQLIIKQQQLIDSNQRYADSGQRLRRAAFNQSFLRLSILVASESASVAEQLDDDAICPPDLRGFAWNVLRQSAQRTVVGWYVDDRGLLDVAISDTREKGQSVSLWDTANGKLVSTTKIPTSTKQPVYFQDRLLVGLPCGKFPRGVSFAFWPNSPWATFVK